MSKCKKAGCPVESEDFGSMCNPHFDGWWNSGKPRMSIDAWCARPDAPAVPTLSDDVKMYLHHIASGWSLGMTADVPAKPELQALHTIDCLADCDAYNGWWTFRPPPAGPDRDAAIAAIRALLADSGRKIINQHMPAVGERVLMAPATVTPPACPRCAAPSSRMHEGQPYCDGPDCKAQLRYLRAYEKPGVFAGMFVQDVPGHSVSMNGLVGRGRGEYIGKDAAGQWVPLSAIGHVKGVK